MDCISLVDGAGALAVGSSLIVLTSSSIQGPADHAPPKLPGPSGGKFNLSNPKSDVDWMIYRAQGQVIDRVLYLL